MKQNKRLATVPRPSGQVATRVQSIEASYHSGPLPPAEDFEHYNNVLPGAADRIMKMAEQQATHRRSIEAAVITGNIKAQARGQSLGALVVIAAMLIGGFLIYSGRPTEGFVSMFTPLAVIAGLFVWGRRKQEAERDKKARENP